MHVDNPIPNSNSEYFTVSVLYRQYQVSFNNHLRMYHLKNSDTETLTLNINTESLPSMIFYSSLVTLKSLKYKFVKVVLSYR